MHERELGIAGAFRAPLLAVGLVLTPGCTNAPEAEASTPSLAWAGVQELGVQCVLTSTLNDRIEWQDRLCARVRDLAAQRAPVPVSVVAIGDPAVMNPNRLTLLVHGSVQGGSGASRSQDRLLVLALRPFRSGEPVLYGAAPRAAPFEPNGPGQAADGVLRAALAELLPWQAAQPSARVEQ